MRTWIKAKEGYWLTQSEQNPTKEARVFVRALPVNTKENWTEWSDAEKEEWEKSHVKGDAAFLALAKHLDIGKLRKEFGV